MDRHLFGSALRSKHTQKHATAPVVDSLTQPQPGSLERAQPGVRQNPVIGAVEPEGGCATLPRLC